MVKRIALYVTVVGVLVFASSLFGQASPGTGQGPSGGGMHGGPGGHQMPSIDDQVKHLTKQLKLTDDQQSKVHAILQSQRDQMKQLMEDTSTPRPEKRAKMISIHQTTTGKIRDLLNDDQKKKYDDMLQQQQERRQEHRGGTGPS